MATVDSPSSNSLTFLEGLSVSTRGFGFLLGHRTLWRHAVLPATFNLLFTLLSLSIVVGAVALWWWRILPWFTKGQEGVQRGLWLAAAIACGLLLALLAIVIAMLAYRIASTLVCSGLYATLAMATERTLGIDDGELGEISFRADVTDTALDLGVWVRQQTLSVFVACLPFIGPFLAAAISSYATFFQMGLDYLQYPLALRGQRRDQRLQFARRHRSGVLGIGGSVFVIEWLPVASSILLPSIVVGCVLLHRRVTGQQPPAKAS